MTLQAQDEKHWLSKMAQQLSGVTVILIIAGGFLLFWLLFIFAKRQIMRFTLRSHRGPHAPIGLDAKKVLVFQVFYIITWNILFQPRLKL